MQNNTSLAYLVGHKTITMQTYVLMMWQATTARVGLHAKHTTREN